VITALFQRATHRGVLGSGSAVVTAALLALCGCAIPRLAAGDRCGEDAAVCASDKEVLVCRGGRLEPVPCRGPRGCKVGEGREVSCDQSTGGLPDEPCLAPYEGQVACVESEPSAYVQCRGGKWEKRACDGVCRVSSGLVVCE
jgi:hypothetical protein